MRVVHRSSAMHAKDQPWGRREGLGKSARTAHDRVLVLGGNHTARTARWLGMHGGYQSMLTKAFALSLLQAHESTHDTMLVIKRGVLCNCCSTASRRTGTVSST